MTFLPSILSLLLLLSIPLVSSDPSVSPPCGPINGFFDGLINEYLGIPYAQPPVSALRFAPPQTFPAFSSPYSASSYANGCIQQCDLPPGSCPVALSEDCLYLNVYQPANWTATSALPVMAFIPGGNFRQGTAGCPLYNASQLVYNTDVIVVTMNYRLGAFGFFWNQDVPTNLGLQDQQMVLEWIQTNIASFGGDPEAVTVWGQSAGATSVASHLQNAKSLSLFSRAIMESLPAGIELRLPEESASLNQAFVKVLGCSLSDTACIMGKSSDDILAAQVKSSTNIGAVNFTHFFELFQPWEPTVWSPPFYIGHFITDFFSMVGSGQIQLNVPILMGTTSEEAYVFVWEAFSKNTSSAEAAAVETFLFGLGNYLKIEDLYPLHIFKSGKSFDARIQMSQLTTDFLFQCAARGIGNSYVRDPSNANNIFFYQFSHVADMGSKGWGPHYPECWDRVCHGAELPFVFNAANALGFPFPPLEEGLASLMGLYWTNFAKTGNPNTPVAVSPAWPPFDAASESLMNLDLQPAVESNPKATFCNLWDKLGYKFEAMTEQQWEITRHIMSNGEQWDTKEFLKDLGEYASKNNIRSD